MANKYKVGDIIRNEEGCTFRISDVYAHKYDGICLAEGYGLWSLGMKYSGSKGILEEVTDLDHTYTLKQEFHDE